MGLIQISLQEDCSVYLPPLPERLGFDGGKALQRCLMIKSQWLDGMKVIAVTGIWHDKVIGVDVSERRQLPCQG